MAAPIEDPSSLPGKSLFDQNGSKIGEIKELYEMGDEGEPMWVTVEATYGIADKKLVFVPLARMKEEDDQIRVPYNAQRLQDVPDADAEDTLSEETDRALRDFYAIDHADTELRTDNDSYASRVPEGEGTPKKAGN